MHEWYDRVRSAQWRALERSDPERVRWLRSFDALHLYGTIGSEAVLRSDGTVWIASDDHWDDPTGAAPEWRVADKRERTSALVIAGERMPEVRSLLPTRPSTAVDCPRCYGTGYFFQSIVCPECGALGWLEQQAT